MVKINTFKEIPVQLWHGKEFIGVIENNLSFLDVRIQIKAENDSDYFIIFDGQKLSFDNYGQLMSRPKGLFDTFDNLCDRILGLE
jgi:hypothetical protein